MSASMQVAQKFEFASLAFLLCVLTGLGPGTWSLLRARFDNHRDKDSIRQNLGPAIFPETTVDGINPALPIIRTVPYFPQL